MADTTMMRIHIDLKQQIKVQAAKAGMSMIEYIRRLVDADKVNNG